MYARRRVAFIGTVIAFLVLGTVIWSGCHHNQNPQETQKLSEVSYDFSSGSVVYAIPLQFVGSESEHRQEIENILTKFTDRFKTKVISYRIYPVSNTGSVPRILLITYACN